MEREGLKLKLVRQYSGQMAASLAPAPAEAAVEGAPASGDGQPQAAPPPPPPASNLHEIRSPIVGTFYRSPNPQSDVFVESGSMVKRGQVLCIVEAMKLMNEIESDTDGEVVDILVANGQPVEYGEVLFRLRPSAG